MGERDYVCRVTGTDIGTDDAETRDGMILWLVWIDMFMLSLVLHNWKIMGMGNGRRQAVWMQRPHIVHLRGTAIMLALALCP